MWGMRIIRARAEEIAHFSRVNVSREVKAMRKPIRRVARIVFSISSFVNMFFLGLLS